ncbi:hypothetical protein ACET3Z_025732 [Daucus carota]
MVLAGLKEEGYCSCMMSRDEFGLPVFGDKTESRPIPSPADKVLEHLPQSNPFKDKMKSKIEEPPTVKQAQESVKEPVKSWSQVAQSSEIELDFCPLPKAGKPLPTSIPAITLDPMTENKIQVEVRVEYPSKLLFCSGCKSLGHITGACPITKRVWVAKEKPVESIPSVASSNPTRVTPDPVPQPETLEKPVSPPSPKEAPWIEVKRKGHTPSTSDEESPSPLQTFKSLKRIDEIEQKAQQAKPQLSKHQLKKLKKSQGKSSPSSAH